jgi:prepilin-type N-terminal cleavage/methylation domain-containing protein
MKKNLAAGKSGFTFVEVTVVIGIMALLATAVFSLFSSTTSNQQKMSADLQMQSMALGAQNRIVRMIREGQGFIIPEPGEDSPALFFTDNENNICVLYQLKDEDLSKRSGKELYKLMHYRVKSKDFNPASPAYNPEMSATIAEYIKDIKFHVSGANTVNVTASFATERAEFQTMFEIGLQSSGVTE